MSYGQGYGNSGYGTGGGAGGVYTYTAISVSRTVIRVTFSEEMVNNVALTTPGNYGFTAVYGVVPTVSTVTVASLGEGGGVLSVNLSHSGTTHAGLLNLTIAGPIATSGAISAGGAAATLTLGRTTFSISRSQPDSNTVRLDFQDDLLGPGTVPAVAYPVSYQITPSDYPITPAITGVTHSPTGDDSIVDLAVIGVTETNYTIEVNPADAIIYDATELPSDASGFTGTESGTGTTTVSGSSIFLSKDNEVSYGWDFLDTSTRITNTGTLYCKVVLDCDNAFPQFVGVDGYPFQWEFSDGTAALLVEFGIVSGQQIIRFTSGGFTTTVTGNWFDASILTLEFVRNTRAGHVGFIWNNTPVLSEAIATINGAPSVVGGAGAAVRLTSGAHHKATNFEIRSVEFTASDTIFTVTSDFIHSATTTFTGLGSGALDTLLTEHGPLVKDWGDDTPATKNDVEVRVQGVAVDIESVNPYTGAITLDVPIPLLPPYGTLTVAVLPSAPDTVTINGDVLTAVAGAPGVDEFQVGADTTETATNIATAINDSANSFDDTVWATSAGNVVTIKVVTGVDPTTVTLVSGTPDIVASGPTLALPVEVDYKWLFAPTFEMVGLNTKGLALNTVHTNQGHHYPPSPALGSFSGKVSTRFPMTLVLPGVERFKPRQTSYRYLGFERDYTASLNSPTTLLLNRSPHDVALPKFEQVPSASTASYEALVAPTAASPAWTLTGTDTGSVGDESNYLLTDAGTGNFGSDSAAFYYREEDLVFPSTVTMGVRVAVSSYTLDGVFTGIGFGAHQRDYLHLLGLLEINGVKHVGRLLNGNRPDLQESWDLGPTRTITILDSQTATLVTASGPTGLEENDQFQVFSGTQAGTYTLDTIVNQTDGTTTLTIKEEFPADPTRFGNDTASAVFETDWSVDTTFRMAVNTETGESSFYIAGEIAGEVSSTTAPVAYPVQMPLLLPNTQKGAIFWGSLSRVATNTSSWSLVRYGVQPSRNRFAARAVVAAAEMSDTPEDDPNNIWFFTQKYGYSEIDVSGDTLLLKSTSASSERDESFGYSRIEPFFVPGTFLDLDSAFKIETGVLAEGDGQIVFNDTNREVKLSNLSYIEDALPLEITDDLPQESLDGTLVPTETGWSESAGFTLDTPVASRVFAQDGLLTLDQQRTVITGTFTVLTVPAPADTVSINGVVLTAVAGPPGFNQFEIGADVFETATNLADAINNPANGVDTFVEADAEGFVVDMVSKTHTLYTLATSDPGSILRSGATMSGTPQTGTFETVFDVPAGAHTGRIIEARFRVRNWDVSESANILGTTLQVAAGTGGSQKLVGIRLIDTGTDQQVRLYSGGTAESSAVDFAWDDGEFHTYKIYVDPDRDEVFLLGDGVLLDSMTFTALSTAPGTDDEIIMGSSYLVATSPVMTVTDWDYLKVATSEPKRRLIQDMASVSYSGLKLPTDDGWEEDAATLATFDPAPIEIQQDNLVFPEMGIEEISIFRKELSAATIDQRGSYVFEVRFKAHDDYQTDAGLYGFVPQFNFAYSGSLRALQLQFFDNTSPPTVGCSGIVGGQDFDWTDGEFHTYRVVADADADTVTLTIDDTLIATGTVSGTTFVFDNENALALQVGSTTVAPGTLEIDYAHAHSLPRLDVKRTLGIKLGENPLVDYVEDIDRWKIPRTDFTTALNSSMSATVEEMDWTQLVDCHLHLDPTWGVTLKRPDLAAPPKPADPPTDTGFATQSSRPFDGWISVEYPNLPRVPQNFGQVKFGALESEAISQQRWGRVRYHIYEFFDEDVISPHHMVLNQYNVVNSGEFLKDITPEVVEVASLTTTLVSLKPAHIYADRVFSVSVSGTVIPMSQWSFDQASQTITLTSPLAAAGTTVRVTFAPGNPITCSYLQAQPVVDGITLLNDGVPPFAMTQTGSFTSVTETGSQINDPNDTMNDDPDFVLNDQLQYVGFENDAELLYEQLQFCNVDDGGLDRVLSSICEDFGRTNAEGGFEIGLSGGAGAADYEEIGFQIKDTEGGYEQNESLIAQGDGSQGGVLGTAVLCPTSPQQRGYPRVLMYDATTLAILLDTTLETKASP